MKKFKDKVRQRIELQNKEISGIYEKNAATVIGEVSVKHLLGGMRGLKAMVCNTSFVDPYKGLFISGYEVPEFASRLPEEIFFLLCTGSFPNGEELEDLQMELHQRAEVPEFIWKMIKGFPKTMHPMTLFSLGILAMEGLSVFKEKYQNGIPKSEHWEYTLEDSLNLIAKLPSLAAGIYRIHYRNGSLIPFDKSLDWGANLTNMLGVNNRDASFAELVRLYLVLHCDHEGGNVSAFTARIVNSALSNIYYATSAGLNGLAGPLHGLANQECLRFIQNLHEKLGSSPGKEEMRDFIIEILNSGKVIPGYGHAVLRVTDPRFTAFWDFGEKHCSNSPYFQTVKNLFDIVPDILKNYKEGKIANPWPNVDAISGTLLYHYGIDQFDFYTVMFGISRTLGFCAQNVIARGLNQPIIRPKSVTNEWLTNTLNKMNEGCGSS